MISADDIRQLFRDLPVSPDWSFAEYKPSETGKWTHGYHRYPAKFIPQLVEKLMDEYAPSRGAHINDPFCGCGTTIVTALSRGARASGTDINRIAHLITRVKATPIEPAYLGSAIERFLDAIDSGSDRGLLIPETHHERIDYWFPEPQKLALGLIRAIIEQESDALLRDFLLVAFSHVLKNCSIWLQGSTKPTRDFTKKPIEPRLALRRHLRKMERGNRAYWQVVPDPVKQNLADYLHVRLGDARCQPVPDASVDLIVSSSPYVTSYEYADLHQLSTIWLDLAPDLKAYRREFIGTAHKLPGNNVLRSQIASDIVAQMQEQSPKMAGEIEAFFVDMEEVFDESHRILKPGGRCCFVIGNTRLRKVDILNAEVFAESLRHAGFCLDRVIKREIPSKILPQKRDEKTGRFAASDRADTQAYPVEYIVIGLKM